MSSLHCVFCRESLSTGQFCPSCGARQPASSATADPLIGKLVAERYEIIELVKAGGMGRVYRAVQRTLDRVVALKIIDPHVLTLGDADEISARFMSEARTASRLNHPNVISIFDFGRSDGNLFLAMEFLEGPTLSDELIQGDKLLPFPRIAAILRQVLAALGEAHHLGITHRDVKPDNVVLERLRGEGDRVKVIDFGIATMGDQRRTEEGRLMGTPHYMAPECLKGVGASPSVDLYAAGVMLFEMLTGRVPFDAATPIAVLNKHATSPRPDPRVVAPPARNIPPALVEVCFRALAIDPTKRYADAKSLAEAIVSATSEGAWTARDASLFPPPPTGRPSDVELADTVPPPSSRTSPDTEPERAAFVGREEHVAWAKRHLFAVSPPTAIVFFGRAGTGRTRLLGEVAELARRGDASVVAVAPPPPPRDEVGFGFLRTLVATLVGLPVDDEWLRLGTLARTPLVATGLRALYATHDASAGDKGLFRRALRSVVAWAAGHAVAEASSHVVLTIDDVDRADSGSRAVLWDFVRGEPVSRFSMVVTCEERPTPAMSGGAPALEVLGLTREEVRKLVGGGARPSLAAAVEGAERRIEPLYLELFARWRAEGRTGRVPNTLAGLVDSRLQALTPAQRRLLQAVALVGEGTLSSLHKLVPTEERVGDSLATLRDAGWLKIEEGRATVAHASFARDALAGAPAGAIEHLHALAADALEDMPELVELRAYHAIRGRPDFEAFLYVEESARLRSLWADEDGAIAALSDGCAAARTQIARGNVEGASSAWIVFGRKLASALFVAQRVEQAEGVLREVLHRLGEDDPARAGLLEQLALIAAHRGKHDEAERLRAEAASSISEQRPSFSKLREKGSGPGLRRYASLREEPEALGRERQSHTRIQPHDDRVEGDEEPASNRGS